MLGSGWTNVGSEDEPLWLSREHVVMIEPCGDRECAITLSTGKEVFVNTAATDVANRLQDAIVARAEWLATEIRDAEQSICGSLGTIARCVE